MNKAKRLLLLQISIALAKRMQDSTTTSFLKVCTSFAKSNNFVFEKNNTIVLQGLALQSL
ncbi:hypothetical protein EON73_01615 [bacterium]|nr:MAG: hypothetical protein EON73_01615 [bacterium]